MRGGAHHKGRSASSAATPPDLSPVGALSRVAAVAFQLGHPRRCRLGSWSSARRSARPRRVGRLLVALRRRPPCPLRVRRPSDSRRLGASRAAEAVRRSVEGFDAYSGPAASHGAWPVRRVRPKAYPARAPQGPRGTLNIRASREARVRVEHLQLRIRKPVRTGTRARPIRDGRRWRRGR
jgi:hypothetical protein